MEWLIWVCGVFVGVFSSIFWTRKLRHGTLKIDHSNPEKDVYRFEIEDIDKLNSKRYITLKIDHNADLSQN